MRSASLLVCIPKRCGYGAVSEQRRRNGGGARRALGGCGGEHHRIAGPGGGSAKSRAYVFGLSAWMVLRWSSGTCVLVWEAVKAAARRRAATVLRHCGVEVDYSSGSGHDLSCPTKYAI